MECPEATLSESQRIYDIYQDYTPRSADWGLLTVEQDQLLCAENLDTVRARVEACDNILLLIHPGFVERWLKSTKMVIEERGGLAEIVRARQQWHQNTTYGDYEDFAGYVGTGFNQYTESMLQLNAALRDRLDPGRVLPVYFVDDWQIESTSSDAVSLSAMPRDLHPVSDSLVVATDPFTGKPSQEAHFAEGVVIQEIDILYGAIKSLSDKFQSVLVAGELFGTSHSFGCGGQVAMDLIDNGITPGLLEGHFFPQELPGEEQMNSWKKIIDNNAPHEIMDKVRHMYQQIDGNSVPVSELGLAA